MSQLDIHTITGEKVTTPTKEQMAIELARLVGVEAPIVLKGSRVDPVLLARIHRARTGEDPAEMGPYELCRAVLEGFELTYDPSWDTSEEGGTTVTSRAYSRMLVAQRGFPRCFVLNSTDASEGNVWETDKQSLYTYDSTVTGRAPFNDAGPGSMVLFYNTSSHSQNPMSFTATARVDYIRGTWKPGPWTAELAEYRDFDSPVPRSRVEIRGRNPQHAITEITWEQYQAIVEAGTGSRPDGETVGVRLDIGGEQVAERIVEDFPAQDVEVVGDDVPGRRPEGDLEVAPERERDYVDGERPEGAVHEPSRRRTAADRRRDKIIEERAVALALKHLETQGWTVTADRQLDGVGYDLDLSDGTRTMHLEVKGIRGPRPEFNLTGKEWWRALTDPDFLLAAVTDALDPVKVRVRLFTPEDIVRADRVTTQYRIAVRSPRLDSGGTPASSPLPAVPADPTKAAR